MCVMLFLFCSANEFVSKNPTINRCMTDRVGAYALGLAAEEELCRASRACNLKNRPRQVVALIIVACAN
jgi:hypothetical protein